MNLRIGHGIDIHQLVPDVPLKLAGIEVPSDHGLAGHSDGDVVLHAICDALLGATARGDLGHYFPPGDPGTLGIDSARILERILEVLEPEDVTIVNLDVTIVAQRPKLAGLFEAMRARLSGLLATPIERISVKAKTTDHLGAIGRGEGIAAHATVLIELGQGAENRQHQQQ